MDEGDQSRGLVAKHDSAALHHPRDHRADAAVHRDAAREEPVRDRLRSARGRGESDVRTLARGSAAKGGEIVIRAGVSRVEARYRAPAAACLEATDDGGSVAFKGGADAYMRLRERYTTTKLTAERDSRDGSRRWRIEGEMDAYSGSLAGRRDR